MPGMNGYDATRTIRNFKNEETIPFTSLTAHHGKNEQDKCLSAGCSGAVKTMQRENAFGSSGAIY